MSEGTRRAAEDVPRVIVCGAGFAGLWAAQRLAGSPAEVLLIDRQNYHTFLPLLYQVAAAELSPTDIAYPIRSILRDSPGIDVRMGEVTGVDLDRRTVTCNGELISWDHLVVATGSVPDFFGIEGAEEHTYQLRDMKDAIPLRHRVLTRFEQAVHERDEERRRRLLTFVIVGGGATGVEYAGALAELVYGPIVEDYPAIPTSQVRVVLLEAGRRLLASMHPKSGKYAADRLVRRGVELRLGTAVESVEEGRVLLAGQGPIHADTVVWTAGVRGDPIVQAWGMPVERRGRVPVAPGLHLEGRRDVWVAGDLSWVTDESGEPLPQVAPVAIQQGELVADNIVAVMEGRDPEPFRYQDLGMLAVIGRNAAVAELGGRRFKGFVAWVLWLVIHIAKLIGFRNRMLVLVNWGWNYLWYRRAVRLVLPTVVSAEPAPPTPGRSSAPPRGG